MFQHLCASCQHSVHATSGTVTCCRSYLHDAVPQSSAERQGLLAAHPILGCSCARYPQQATCRLLPSAHTFTTEQLNLNSSCSSGRQPISCITGPKWVRLRAFRRCFFLFCSNMSWETECGITPAFAYDRAVWTAYPTGQQGLAIRQPVCVKEWCH